jgi:hypothetical protein
MTYRTPFVDELSQRLARGEAAAWAVMEDIGAAPWTRFGDLRNASGYGEHSLLALALMQPSLERALRWCAPLVQPLPPALQPTPETLKAMWDQCAVVTQREEDGDYRDLPSTPFAIAARSSQPWTWPLVLTLAAQAPWTQTERDAAIQKALWPIGEAMTQWGIGEETALGPQWVGEAQTLKGLGVDLVLPFWKSKMEAALAQAAPPPVWPDLPPFPALAWTIDPTLPHRGAFEAIETTEDPVAWLATLQPLVRLGLNPTDIASERGETLTTLALLGPSDVQAAFEQAFPDRRTWWTPESRAAAWAQPMLLGKDRFAAGSSSDDRDGQRLREALWQDMDDRNAPIATWWNEAVIPTLKAIAQHASASDPMGGFFPGQTSTTGRRVPTRATQLIEELERARQEGRWSLTHLEALGAPAPVIRAQLVDAILAARDGTIVAGWHKAGWDMEAPVSVPEGTEVSGWVALAKDPEVVAQAQRHHIQAQAAVARPSVGRRPGHRG